MSRPLARRVLPGFGLTMGITVLYLSLIVLIPLATLPAKTLTMSWQAFHDTITDPRVVASYRLSLGASLAAAAVNAVFGFAVAWVLARYSFPGRRIIDALIDLPFALPTAVAGIVLTTLYAPNGWLGAPLARHGIRVAFTPLGVTIALIFIGLPFVVRTLQPVIEDLDPEIEEAATSLGATRAGVLVRVVLPNLFPAWLTGFALAFARAVGEATQLAGRDVKVVHMVGGGARNELLCQLTADACGRPVVAGPFEATALGNILIQARSIGLAEGTLESLRALVRASQSLKRYEPSLGSDMLGG